MNKSVIPVRFFVDCADNNGNSCICRILKPIFPSWYSGRQGAMQKKMIAWSHINSGSHNEAGLRAMRAQLCTAFAPLPGVISEPHLQPGKLVEPNGRISDIDYEPAMLLQVRPEADIQIVLTGHYDTVFPQDSHFQTTRHLGEDKLGGPGVADMKGGILVMLEALKAFETTNHAYKVGYSVLLSPDEEIGSPGSAPLLAALGRKAHIGLTYEPALADGSLAGARKGSGNFALIIKGRAAHAGREHHLGRNAVNAMARFCVAMDALNGEREGVTFNMAKIDGGGAVNIVPDLAIGRFNVRMLHTEDQVWIKTKLEALVEQANREDGIENPIGVGSLKKHFLPGFGIDRAKCVVGTPHRNQLAVGRPACAVDGVERDGDGVQQFALGNVPYLELAKSSRRTPGDCQPLAVGRE